MDRNSAIGLTLIALLLIIYFQFIALPPPAPEQPAAESARPQSTEKTETTIEASIQPAPTISGIAQVEERTITVENQDLVLEFSNRGGVISKATLKDYFTYNKEPLVLFDQRLNRFSLTNNYNGKDVDLYQLTYEYTTTKINDTTRVVFTLKDSSGVLLKQIYAIPPQGFSIEYSFEDVRSNFVSADNLLFKWDQQISQKERDPKETYNHTAINYYSLSSGFDGLSERSTDTERELLEMPLKWVAITEKFFTTAILAETSFAAGEIKTNPSAADDIVKEAHVELLMSGKDLREGNANFSYYLGPNKYNILKKVDTDFSRNVYLGWPPVIWVNKFIIIPLFQLFEKFVSNYGIIIILIVLAIKIALTPLSYRSYLSMAKMKVLKPELDEIKAQHGDDMTKIQQEQMKLYQQVGVNPLSGCVPLLLQMPILFAMFYFFPVSIELRQEAFLWADDLSTYDAFINLPFTIPFYGSHVSLFTLLMTASTIVYTWQNNQISSVQGPMKTMGYIMPVVFMFVLNSFPAALSFYYFVSTLVTFGQQAIIRKFVNEDKIKLILEENRKKNVNKKKSSFQLKLEEAMKANKPKKK